MSRCPKCNAPYDFGEAAYVSWQCGTSTIIGDEPEESLVCVRNQLTAAHARIAELERCEQECEAAAAILQAALPIGKVKAIGLRQVAAASAGLALASTDKSGELSKLRDGVKALAAEWRRESLEEFGLQMISRNMAADQLTALLGQEGT